MKGLARKWRTRAYSFLFSYTFADLAAKLRALGICAGDSVLMQSSFHDVNGFTGEAQDVVECVLGIVGPNGHLFMVSMPYSGAARDYLLKGALFDVRRTPSQMGLISEVFRRRKGVVRSANPMHPVLAYGPRASWLVADHENLPHSCGDNSPFEKMLELDTKALLFDVDLDVLTFTHYLEHRFRDTAPTALYAPEPIDTQISDQLGRVRDVSVYPFATDAMRLRNFGVLYDRLLSERLVEQGRVGNTILQVVNLRNVLRCGADLICQGSHIFANPGEPTRIKPRRQRWYTKTIGHALRKRTLVC